MTNTKKTLPKSDECKCVNCKCQPCFCSKSCAPVCGCEKR